MSAQDIKIGPANISWDGNDLGLTKGGISFSVETGTYAVTVDQFGEIEVDEVIQSRKVMVTVPMVETTIANMNLIMPGSTVTGGKVDVSSGIGLSLLSIAKPLIIIPKGVTDGSETITIPLAATAGNAEFTYQSNEERVYNVTFRGYIDTATDHLFSYGT